MEGHCMWYSICILEANPKQWMLSPLLSPNTWMLSRVSWCVRWGLAFACERSKLGALTAAYLWNSSKTTLILFRLALLEISLSLSLSLSRPSSLAVCLSHPLSPSPVLSSLLIFPASLNYLVSLSFCCEGDVYVGVRVLWGYHYLEGTSRFNITLTSMHPVERIHKSALFTGFTRNSRLAVEDFVWKKKQRLKRTSSSLSIKINFLSPCYRKLLIHHDACMVNWEPDVPGYWAIIHFATNKIQRP